MVGCVSTHQSIFCVKMIGMSDYRRYFYKNNYVFLTVVTYNRKPILIKNIEILRNSFKYAKQKFDFNIVACVIMEDHFHLLISTDFPHDIPKIIKTIKINFTLNISEYYVNNNDLSDSRIKRGEKGIWQRRYYDHIIRDDKDLYRHIDYIHYNSVKHNNISPKDWKYSTFMKFVKNGNYEIDWCNFGDKYNINSMNLE